MDKSGRLALEEDEVRKIWRDYFVDFHNMETKEQVAVHMFGIDGVQRDNKFGGEPITKTKLEPKVR